MSYSVEVLYVLYEHIRIQMTAEFGRKGNRRKKEREREKQKACALCIPNAPQLFTAKVNYLWRWRGVGWGEGVGLKSRLGREIRPSHLHHQANTKQRRPRRKKNSNSSEHWQKISGE